MVDIGANWTEQVADVSSRRRVQAGMLPSGRQFDLVGEDVRTETKCYSKGRRRLARYQGWPPSPDSRHLLTSSRHQFRLYRRVLLVAKSVFYSFHYDRDVHRVQLVRYIDALVGQPVLNSQDWEQVRRRGSQAIANWIHDQMKYKKAVIVLIGRETAARPWVIYELQKAWQDRKPLLGVRIHGLSSLGSTDSTGGDPFAAAGGISGVPIFDPTVHTMRGTIDSKATYSRLAANIGAWSGQGVVRR